MLADWFARENVDDTIILIQYLLLLQYRFIQLLPNKMNYTCYINGLIRLALFGKRERELIKSGFGLDLTKGNGMAWWLPNNKYESLPQPDFIIFALKLNLDLHQMQGIWNLPHKLHLYLMIIIFACQYFSFGGTISISSDFFPFSKK